MTATPDVSPILQFDQVRKEFGRTFVSRRQGHSVTAVDDVSLSVERGESYGLVGETGSGKTTLGRLALRFDTPGSGRILFDGSDISTLRGEHLKSFRRRCQMIFQNPFSTLNPRRSVRDTLGAGYQIHRIASGRDKERRMADLLQRVGLNPEMLDRYPHQLSGGQRQRIVIARALSVGPELIVADEPVSALDVSVQAQVLNLLKSLQEEFALTYVLITHDLRVVNFFSTRIGVMYGGNLVEVGPREVVVSQPVHPYTRALIAAAPAGSPRNRQPRATAIAPDSTAEDLSSHGCVYRARCRLKVELGGPVRCDEERPSLRSVGLDSQVACHFAEQAMTFTTGSNVSDGPRGPVGIEEVTGAAEL